MSQQNDPYNRSGFIAFMFSMVFSFVFFAYVSFVHPPVDLKEVPEEVAGAAQELADTSKIDKLWVENEALIAHGKKVYQTNCMICHGATGKGDGAAGAALIPKPRDLVEGKWTKGGSSIDLYKTLRDGIPGGSMASFKHLPKKDRWALVQYIRAITDNKVSDNAEELEKFAASAD